METNRPDQRTRDDFLFLIPLVSPSVRQAHHRSAVVSVLLSYHFDWVQNSSIAKGHSNVR